MAKRIRIGYLIDTISSDKAGTEKQLLNIIERLDRDRFEVTLICLYASPWMAANRVPCPVVTLGYRGFLKPGFGAVLWRYLCLLRQHRFHVVQTFFEDAIFLGYLGKVLGRQSHALVVSRRDMGLGADEPGYYRLYRKVMPFIGASVDGFCTNARAIKAHLVEKENVPDEKVTVIGNGLELPAPPRQLPPLFRQYGRSLWIGIVANLKPVKRVDLLLRALPHLETTAEQQEPRVLVMGEGRLKSELEQLARELGVAGRVHFTGALENVSDYLHCMDIGVLCSDNEGLSNAILEYMACGLPVVATATGGNGELVDETNGGCVPVGDSLALGREISRLASSAALRRKLGERSLQKVLSRSTWDRVMPQWEEYYRALAGYRDM